MKFIETSEQRNCTAGGAAAGALSGTEGPGHRRGRRAPVPGQTCLSSAKPSPFRPAAPFRSSGREEEHPAAREKRRKRRPEGRSGEGCVCLQTSRLVAWQQVSAAAVGGAAPPPAGRPAALVLRARPPASRETRLQASDLRRLGRWPVARAAPHPPGRPPVCSGKLRSHKERPLPGLGAAARTGFLHSGPLDKERCPGQR